MNPSLTAELYKLAPSAIIELYELDCTAQGGSVFRFHNGTNSLSQNLVWKGNTYTRFPIDVTGFELSGDGAFPRPKLRVSNALSAVTTLLLSYKELLGAKVTRKRTLKKFLDAVNFPGGVNATADTTAEFADDIYYIDRKVKEDRNSVEFELAAATDLAGVFIPRRQIIENSCFWKYRGTECGYSGTNYFDVNDNAVGSSGADVCGKRLSSCKKRFGNFAVLPFGGFPGAGLDNAG